MKKIVILGLIVGTVNLVTGLLLTQIYNFLVPTLAQEYINQNLFRPWSDPLMSLVFLYPFVLGISLSWVWEKSNKLFKGKNIFQKAYKFALFYFIVATIPGMFVTYSSFQVSLALVLSWAFSGFIEVFIAGLIFAKKNA